MIQKHEVINLFLSVCPSYADRWLQYVSESYEDDEESLLYVDLGDFAHHVVDLYQLNQLEEFSNLFTVAEHLHINGDSYVKEAATIGFLEALQNVSSNYDLDPEVFVRFLNPVSLQCWEALNRFWSGKSNSVVVED
ncbi:hypothetical protein POF51_26130 [Brevibacillus sp. AG]|uniref:DUF7674 family protein n=1 Tax=Brevibacillus sp. AG TaxID=3020891 RepID=UPI00232C5F5A|nr:hypothetical protein [Brevibacillus sp. AG]MDC0764202.1 hypothetical protein [Brevibacillus sp. AG]